MITSLFYFYGQDYQFYCKIIVTINGGVLWIYSQ